MKRAWQIWSLYLFCLMAVALAMSWLSLKTFQLEALREADQAETELARREAELQERVSSALYRMDLKMLPLVAQEAARPLYFYQSGNSPAPKQNKVDGAEQQNEITPEKLYLASPLLFAMSDSVLLHFEIDSENTITTPQFPAAALHNAATAQHEISPETSLATQAKIEEARELFDFQTLVQRTLPREGAPIAANSNGSSSSSIQTALAYNVPAVENFLNQMNVPPAPSDTDSGQARTGGAESSSDPSSRVDRQRLLADQRINSALNLRRNSTQEVMQLNGYLGNSGYAGQTLDAVPTPLAQEPIEFLPMQPLWVGKNLVMARRVNRENRSTIQCCWLDWAKIRTDLQTEVAELLPDLQFEAVTAETELKIGTALTTIPVQLIVDRPKMLAMLALDSDELKTGSALPISLAVAWCCLALAAMASALLLHGVVRLSERRAAFVSAVTHELRTPLTTFRMYSEMLADGMVPPEKQQAYASTLKIQADRLSHLVENVLQFARLERGPAKKVVESVTISELLARFRGRLEERATDSQMQLAFSVPEPVLESTLITQPAAVEQVLFNLVDNACKYAQSASDNRIVVSISRSASQIQFSVRDFGPGISPADRKRMYKPFHQSLSVTSNGSSGVGLGLALCERMARSLGGRLIDRPCSPGAIFILEMPTRS